MDEDTIFSVLKFLAGSKCHVYVIAADEMRLVNLSRFPIAIVQNTDPRSKVSGHEDQCYFILKKPFIA